MAYSSVEQILWFCTVHLIHPKFYEGHEWIIMFIYKSNIQNIRNLYRGINDFKKGYQPRCNIVKYEKGHLVADSHSIVASWRNYFSQLFNVHWVKEVRKAEIHTAEPLVPESSAAEFELVIGKLKSH